MSYNIGAFRTFGNIQKLFFEQIKQISVLCHIPTPLGKTHKDMADNDQVDGKEVNSENHPHQGSGSHSNIPPINHPDTKTLLKELGVDYVI